MKTVPAFPRDRELLRSIIKTARVLNPNVSGLTHIGKRSVGAYVAICQETGNPEPVHVALTPDEAVKLGWVG